MYRTLGLVEIPSGAVAQDTSPRSLADRRFAGKPLLEWVVRRVTDSQQLDGVVVVAGTDPRSREAAALTPSDVACYLSTESDALARFASAVRQFEADAIVRIRVGNPFVDPALIDRLITSAAAQPNCDYASYGSGKASAVLSKVGLFAEWCSAESIYRADMNATDPRDREEVTRYIYSHPEKFILRIVPIPPQLDRDDLRLTVDLEEDWEHARVICDALGPESLDWQRIAGLLDAHPAIRERMAVLNRETD